MPRKAADKPATKKTSTASPRKKKADVVAEAVAEITPIVETAASEAPVDTAPKKRGRKPKAAAETVADAPTAPVKKTRGRKKADAPAETTTDAPKKRGRKKAVVEEVVAAPVVETAPVIEAPVAETPAVEAPASESPAKKTRKPRAKKADNAPVDEAPKKRGRKSAKETGPVLTTTLQLGDKEFDITDIAAKAYKEYKRVHKRKVVTDFHIYVKPEEGAAYFTINGEGSEDFKVEL